MPLESASYIGELNPANPTDVDPVAAAAAQLRLIKGAVQGSFPNLGSAAMTLTSAQINAMPADVATNAAAVAINALQIGVNTANIAALQVAPTGVIAMWPTLVVPEDWLRCDGLLIPSLYAELIAIVGPSTPDLKGMFVRGYDASAAVDPDGPGRTIATTIQVSANKSHTHAIGQDGAHTHTIGKEGYKFLQQPGNTRIESGGDNLSPFNFLSEVTSNGANPATHSHPASSEGLIESRPTNVALNYIIKT
jgi:hypothetical protein